MNETKQRYKKLLSEAGLVLLTCVIVTVGYLLYLQFLGIPKTQARNYYNKALIQLEKGNVSEAKESLNEGLKYWDEEYIRTKLNELN